MPVPNLEDQLIDLLLILLAVVLGAIIGFEREKADKPAGLRTHMLVCAGSALLMLLGDSVIDKFQATSPKDALESDPLRIIQAIVIGISFLGTGTIIHQHGDRVEGLTTAATILFTSGIGIAVATGQIVFAVGATLVAVGVLYGVGWGERLAGKRKPAKDK